MKNVFIICFTASWRICEKLAKQNNRIVAKHRIKTEKKTILTTKNDKMFFPLVGIV